MAKNHRKTDFSKNCILKHNIIGFYGICQNKITDIYPYFSQKVFSIRISTNTYQQNSFSLNYHDFSFKNTISIEIVWRRKKNIVYLQHKSIINRRLKLTYFQRQTIREQ